MTKSHITGKKENERAIVLEILIEVLEKQQFSHKVIGMALDKYGYLSEPERAFIARLSRGCVERKTELDGIIDKVSSIPVRKMKPVIRNILRMTVYQMKYMDVPVHAACNEAVKLASQKNFSSLKGFINGVSRNIARRLDELDFSSEPCMKYSVPEWLFDSMSRWYGNETAEAFFEAVLRSSHPLYAHFHTCDAECEKILSELNSQGVEAFPAPYADNCFELKNTGNIRRLKAFNEGLIQIQDISSSLACQCLSPHKGSLCMDICSAPGGKGVYIAKALENTGKVICRDVTEEKLAFIEENRKRCHIENMEIELWNAAITDDRYIGKADYVLADVPCSGIGIIDRKPDIKYQLTEEKLDEIVKLQRSILKASVPYVKKGGVLLYSTCTVNPAENMENVRWLTEEYNFVPEDLSPYISDTIEGCDKKSGCLQLLPGRNKCDGFFIARLRKE